MSAHFKLEEFLTSSVARQKSLENMPSWEIVEHLSELAEFLEDLRMTWGSGIHVNSGFRNPQLNDYVGGVSNSVHMLGYAADLRPVNGDMKGFVACVKNWLKDKDFDQCLIESHNKTVWVHIGLYNNEKKQRHIIKNLSV